MFQENNFKNRFMNLLSKQKSQNIFYENLIKNFIRKPDWLLFKQRIMFKRQLSLIFGFCINVLFLNFFGQVIQRELYEAGLFQRYFLKEQDTIQIDSVKSKVKFKDVVGIDEYKNEILNILNFMKNDEQYQQRGAELPRGIILHGQPGSGKTLLVKALANEADMNFYYKSGSDFESKYYSQGAKNVKKFFEYVRNTKQKSIIFIDEIDSIGKKRSIYSINQTLNQLLTEMDGFNKNQQIFIIGATNKLEHLDEALLRPGRFDQIIEMPTLNTQQIQKIFNHYLDKYKYNYKINFNSIKNQIRGFSGAEIKNLVNLSSINAIKKRHQEIKQNDLEETLQKIQNDNSPKKLTSNQNQFIKALNYSAMIHSALDQDQIQWIVNVDLNKKSLVNFEKQIKNQKVFNQNTLLSQLQILNSCQGIEELIYGDKNLSLNCNKQNELGRYLAELYVINFTNNGIYLSNDQSQKMKHEIFKKTSEINKKSKKQTKEYLKYNIFQIKQLASQLLKKQKFNQEEILNFLDYIGEYQLQLLYQNLYFENELILLNIQYQK